MTLLNLVLIITGVALVMTLLLVLVLKKQKKSWVSFLQNWTGVLFIISGWVKAIDPMGTAFKMEEYFAEFQAALEPTWLSFLAKSFPWFVDHSIGFSVFMIVLEIVLGFALILGWKPKLTSWLFFLIVLFFLALTGFTFLTGYVPSNSTFFELSAWGPWVKEQMRVTDCGCFGDFLVLDPRTSFFKDVVLMAPAILFLFQNKHFHQLLTAPIRHVIIALTTVGLTYFCLSNYMWNLPSSDFRPFKEGTDVYTRRNAEIEAMSNRQITGYRLTNKTSGKVVELPYEEYMANLANYPKTDWSAEQILSEPAIQPTKISDYAIYDEQGDEITEDLLTDPNYTFMVVSYMLKADESVQRVTVQDSIWKVDTIQSGDSLELVRSFEIQPKETTEVTYHWDSGLLKKYAALKPFVDAAKQAGIKVYVVAGGASTEKRNAFREATGVDVPFYEADDILLKTIIRSNPGIVLMKQGVVVKKWHINKLPPFTEVEENWMK
ncbi:MAG: hypothetical protein KDC59_16075 [Saprospiraceae bacterium]|nr:hypothetical protein [Saprospiraceae bacterium]HPG05787.1 hypothetical protein [Saprospiraceae bacterium]